MKKGKDFITNAYPAPGGGSRGFRDLGNPHTAFSLTLAEFAILWVLTCAMARWHDEKEKRLHLLAFLFSVLLLSRNKDKGFRRSARLVDACVGLVGSLCPWYAHPTVLA